MTDDEATALIARVEALEADRKMLADAGVRMGLALFEVIQYVNAHFLSVDVAEAEIKKLSDSVTRAHEGFATVAGLTDKALS